MCQTFIIIVLCLVVRIIGLNYSNEWLMKANLTYNEADIVATKNGFQLKQKLTDDLFLLIRRNTSRFSSRKAQYKFKNIGFNNQINLIEQQVWTNVSLRQFIVDDPLWNQMWYIDRTSPVSMKILEAWKSNFTGQGVRLAIVDNGVEYTHKDLTDRYSVEHSRDVYDHDRDPSPAHGDRHGTRCAGIAVASKNTVCTIGIAHQALLVAVRMIGPFGVTDAGKASALSNNGAHVSSNSWGGVENTFDGPSNNVEDALKYGAEKLRGGKGVIYVFSAGNGGFDDNCNADGYINSIYTIGINAVSRDLKPPGYAEPCTAVLASAFSGHGSGNIDNLCSTDVGGVCTTQFSGTSAATAVAAGIFALVLEANPDLTWRDMQELIVITSKSNGLLNGNFKTNGVGRQVSDWFGYGLLDTEALITTAHNWTCLQTQHTCSSGQIAVNRGILANNATREVESSISMNGCNATINCVSRIEHVQVTVTYDYSLRGAVIFYLNSPMGTRVELLSRRNDDKESNGRHTWTLMSVQHWGEDPVGTWNLKMSLQYDWTEHGTLINWNLIIHGTGSECSPEEITTECPSFNYTSDTEVTTSQNTKTTKLLEIGIGTGVGVLAVSFIILILICFCKKKDKVRDALW